MAQKNIADLFCGAGGSSTGAVIAAQRLSLKINLLAINHWPTAVATHTRNHPWAEHLCADLGSVDPSKVVPKGKLDLLIASPECTHHSVARGGKPCSDQSRASAWHVTHWAERLRIKHILVENVREFQKWGPLTTRGKPMKSRQGETFNAWINSLKSLGYNVEHRVLNAADYGDATTRKRLFVQASRGKIHWPDPTHYEPGKDELLGGKEWVPARDVIDWGLEGNSIYSRKRPLAERTMLRIEAGLRKFCGLPFVTIARGPTNEPDRFAKSVDRPLPVFVAGGKHLGLCEPFIVQTDQTGGNGKYVRGTGQPLYTACTKQNMALVEPFLVNMKGKSKAANINKPSPTLTTKENMALCQPFIVPAQAGGAPRSTKKPLPTLTTTSRGVGLCQPYLVEYHNGKGSERRIRSVDRPMATQDTSNRFGLAQPFLVKFYRTGTAQPVTKPLDTVTAKGRFGLAQPVVLQDEQGNTYLLDIRFRMLQPHELAGAMGFEEYEFTGNKSEQVRQIGNAVPVNTAAALCEAILRN